MGAYLPWITAIAVIAILVMVSMPYMMPKKPCGCKDATNVALNTAIQNAGGGAPVVIDPSSATSTSNTVAGDIAQPM